VLSVFGKLFLVGLKLLLVVLKMSGVNVDELVEVNSTVSFRKAKKRSKSKTCMN
jgi:hypothetical protein